MKVKISHYDLVDLITQLNVILDKSINTLHPAYMKYEEFVIDLDGYELQFSMEKK